MIPTTTDAQIDDVEINAEPETPPLPAGWCVTSTLIFADVAIDFIGRRRDHQTEETKDDYRHS
jgi:hypothetical protein